MGRTEWKRGNIFNPKLLKRVVQPKHLHLLDVTLKVTNYGIRRLFSLILKTWNGSSNDRQLKLCYNVNIQWRTTTIADVKY